MLFRSYVVLSREVGLVSTAEQLNAAGDSAVNQGHTAPAPETFVQFSEVSVVQTVIRIEDDSLRDRRTSVPFRFKKNRARDIGMRLLHDGDFLRRATRSETRRVGKECVSMCRSRRSP